VSAGKGSRPPPPSSPAPVSPVNYRRVSRPFRRGFGRVSVGPEGRRFPSPRGAMCLMDQERTGGAVAWHQIRLRTLASSGRSLWRFHRHRLGLRINSQPLPQLRPPSPLPRTLDRDRQRFPLSTRSSVSTPATAAATPKSLGSGPSITTHYPSDSSATVLASHRLCRRRGFPSTCGQDFRLPAWPIGWRKIYVSPGASCIALDRRSGSAVISSSDLSPIS
jgi:hypothetical protein